MPDCPNLHCRTFSGERTQIVSDANYCIACGTAVTLKAEEEQKRKLDGELKIANTEISTLNTEISTLNAKLSKAKKNKNKIETDLINAEARIKSLEAKLDDEIKKNGLNNNQEQILVMPNWIFVVFCIIGIVFIVLLTIFHNE